jgi:SagB-type dehydrogenase family enzyme
VSERRRSGASSGCDRRRFLLGLAALGTGVLASRPARAANEPLTARWIHDRTRNTRLGAIGVRLRSRAGTFETRKAYPGLRRIELEPVAALDEPPLGHVLVGGSGRRAPAFSEVGRLLHLANGVTGEDPKRRPLRAAPSAGALYANEIYVVAADVPGLASGTYYYDPLDAALVALASGPPSVTQLAALGQPTAAPAYVLVSSIFARSERRYANRGYRYALIDTGHIAENLELAARSAGIAAERIAAFDDEALHAWLGLDASAEGVCAVTALGPARATNGSVPMAWAEAQRVRTPTASGASDTMRWHAATRLVPWDGPSDLRSQAWPRAAATGAPIDGLRGVSADRAILARRSARAFTSEPIAAEAFDLLAAAALARTHSDALGALSLAAVVNRVGGVEPGHWAWSATTRRWQAVRRASLAAELRRVCLGQALAETAAAAFVVVGDTDVIQTRFGARGQRDAWIEAGRIAQRVYLLAETFGLRARNLAAFVDHDLAGLLALGQGPRAPLHLIVVGREPRSGLAPRR